VSEASAASGNVRELSFLRQRLSVLIQWFNAVLISETFPSDDIPDLYSLISLTFIFVLSFVFSPLVFTPCGIKVIIIIIIIMSVENRSPFSFSTLNFLRHLCCRISHFRYREVLFLFQRTRPRFNVLTPLLLHDSFSIDRPD